MKLSNFVNRFVLNPAKSRTRVFNRSYRVIKKPLFCELLEDRRLLAAVVIDPGAFVGDYILGSGGSVSGENTFDLAPGSYQILLGNATGTTIPNAAASRFFFDVDTSGNVTSQAPASATGVGNTLTFNTVPITIDPGSYSGLHMVASVGGRIYQPDSGLRTVDLVPGIQYPLALHLYWTTFDVNATGQVAATSNPDAVSMVGNTLSFNTVAVNVETSGFAGIYQIDGINAHFSGSRSIDLVPGVPGYDFRIGSSNTPIMVGVDTSGTVTSGNPIAVSSVVNTLTFNTTPIHIERNGFSGRVFVSFVAPFDDLNPLVVKGLSNYQLAIAHGPIAVTFDVSFDGTVASDNSAVATSSGDTLSLQTTEIRIDPDGFAGTYQIHDVATLQGTSNVVLVNGFNPYRIQRPGSQNHLFGLDNNGTPSPSVLPVTFDGIEYEFRLSNNSPPLITSTDRVSITENRQAVHVVTASDTDIGQSMTFAIGTGGADRSLFSILPNGELRFIVPPDYETPLDSNRDNVYEVEVKVDDGNGGADTQRIYVTVLNQASVTGTVFVDVNRNELFDANEIGIDGVVVQLLDATGNPIMNGNNQAIQMVTSEGGFYLFDDLDPGTYQLVEIQPVGVTDGAEVLGSIGGTIVSNDKMQLELARLDASDYYFAELGGQVSSGDAATIGFWQNKNGQALIASGGAVLATWLTTNFGNVFGNTFTDGSGGDDGVEVASFYKNELFKKKATNSAGPAKVDAQFMATALSAYFTSSNFAGSGATTYGFNVTDTGIGTRVVNVGSSGAAFAVANNSDLTIMQLLYATNNMTDQPDLVTGASIIYDTDGDGEISAEEAELRVKANLLYSFINELGGI